MVTSFPVYQAKFSVGQTVQHQLLEYRGIVLDVDANFQLSEEWYEKNGLSQPSKDEPWYHVLVHGSSQMTYVAEANLQPDSSHDHIEHPVVDLCFDRDAHGQYQRRISVQ